MMNCNILIPTYNRPEYLKRILNYYDSFDEKFKVIVGDSSSAENKKLNRKIISDISNLDIKYLDHYSSELNPHHKFADMVNYADEKYCVFCADDDFVVPNGIKKSMDFLENNHDFVCAHGIYVSFNVKFNNNEQTFDWMPGYIYDSITFANAKERLEHHFINYCPTFYSVNRTEVIISIYQKLLDSTVDPIQFGEFLPSMLTIISGKMKKLDVLYAARQVDSRISDWPTLVEYIKQGIYDSEYAKFKNCLADYLSDNSRLDVDDSKKVIDDSMAIYMNKHYYGYKYRLRVEISRALDYLKLPNWMTKKIRLLYRRFFVSKEMGNSPVFSNKSSIYYNDFDRIRFHVVSFFGNNGVE